MSGYGDLPARRRLLVRGAYALTMDPALGEVADCDVLVVDGAISAVGRGVVDASAEEIDGRGTIALPGFVDTHWHVWGTLLRGVVGDGPEHGWFARKARLGGHLSPRDTGRSVRLGLAEGLAAGITTVHDWAHNILSPEDADANLLAHRAVGLRVHFSYGAPSTHPSLSLEQAAKVMADGGKAPDQPMDFTEIERIRGSWADAAAEGLLTVGVAVRGPARSSPAVYRREWELARSLGLRIAMHCAGTCAAVARIRQVQLLAADGLLGSDLLLAHGNHLAADDLALLAEWRIPVSVSPLSELRLAMGFPQNLGDALGRRPGRPVAGHDGDLGER